MPTIERNAKMPYLGAIRGPGNKSECRLALEDLNVGDKAIFSEDEMQTAKSAAAKIKELGQGRFRTKRMGRDLHIWRIE